MERANVGPVFIQDFKGIETSTDLLKLQMGEIPWMHGLLPLSNGRLQRIPGKVCYDPTTTHGSILSIQQLTFSNSTAVMIRHGANISLVSSALTNLKATTGSTNPINPFSPMDGGYEL